MDDPIDRIMNKVTGENSPDPDSVFQALVAHLDISDGFGVELDDDNLVLVRSALVGTAQHHGGDCVHPSVMVTDQEFQEYHLLFENGSTLGSLALNAIRMLSDAETADEIEAVLIRRGWLS